MNNPPKTKLPHECMVKNWKLREKPIMSCVAQNGPIIVSKTPWGKCSNDSRSHHMGVSKNNGKNVGKPPKSSLLIGISIIFTIHFP